MTSAALACALAAAPGCVIAYSVRRRISIEREIGRPQQETDIRQAKTFLEDIIDKTAADVASVKEREQRYGRARD